MSSQAAFAPSFSRKPLPTRATGNRSSRVCSVPTCQVARRVVPAQDPYLYTRRTFVSACGALLGLSAYARLERVAATQEAVATSLQSLQQIRSRVNDIDALINGGKWDAVRTVLGSRPVTSTADICNRLKERSSPDMTGAIVGLREDLMSAIRFLDTSVYANVFIGEDRQILGTKVDYDVPRTYLADLKGALDDLIQLASE